MKKIIFLAFPALMSAPVFAQNITFGIQGGVNLGNVTWKQDTETANTKSKIGLIIGAVAEIPMSDNIDFRPELNFIQKGYKQDESQTFFGQTVAYKADATANFIELPLNFVYKVPAGSGSVFFGLGPSFAFGLSGKGEQTATTSGQSTTEKFNIKFDGKNDATDNNFHLKAFDFSGNVLAGYKMPMGLSISAGYSLGFFNLSVDPANESFKTKGFTVKLGYFFGNGSK